VNFLITGADGFLGRILCGRLLAAWPGEADRFTLIDRTIATAPADPRVTALGGDLGAVRGLDAALDAADVVFHLAAVGGGAAQRDYAASKRVNLDVSLELLEALGRRARPARFVYTSTIAVFGEPMPAAIDDDTSPRPTLTYGAHKLMVETALGNLARLGRVDGIALRLPGLLARPAGDTSMKSAFMSELFHAAAAGRKFVVPTGADATVWAMAASTGVDNLIHAAQLASPPRNVPRAFTLPALRVTMGELAGAVARQTGCDPAQITFERDAVLEAQFGRLPPLTTRTADALGFRHDASLDSLVTRALADAGYGAR
jgi:nucleoside-diphosphate-sugar epimerase